MPPLPHKGIASLLLTIIVMGTGALAQRNDAAKPDVTVTLLGSGGGPNPNPRRFGPSILVQANGRTLLFDCGRGASIRLAQIGMLLGQVRNVFLTHLHSDHIIGLPDLYLTGWGAQGRKTPFRVWGPSGTKEMMEHLQKAFDFDIRIRRDIDEKFVKEGIEVSSTDIKEGVIFQDAGVEPASRSHVAARSAPTSRPVDLSRWSLSTPQAFTYTSGAWDLFLTETQKARGVVVEDVTLLLLRQERRLVDHEDRTPPALT